MTRLRYSADDPREWLKRARSALAHAQQPLLRVDFEDLCYSAQQAAEKAIKGVFVKRKQAFPFTHNLDRLLSLLKQAGLPVPDAILQAGILTPFALEVRYPGLPEEIKEEEYREALAVAESVVAWAEGVILGES